MIINRTSLRNYYRNSRNNIEDPIFTGFTFSIDKLHSPLFFNGDEYYTPESLRNTTNGSTELAHKIEDRLTNAYKMHILARPDDYELNTIEAKNKVDDKKFGYGLQDKYYMDNIYYGAVDYIYMVDKVTESTYSDDIGVSDIGNGTASSGFYEDIEATTNAVLEIQEGSGIIAPDELDKKIDEYSAKITSEVEEEHRSNELARNQAKSKYDEKYAEYNKIEEQINKIQEDIDNEYDKVQFKLDKEFFPAATSCYNMLRSIDGNNKRQAVDKMNDLFKEVSDFLGNKYKYVTFTAVPESMDIYSQTVNSEIDNLNLSEEDREYEETYREFFAITSLKIRNIEKTNSSELQDLKSKRADLEDELYGDGYKGNPGNNKDGNPSLYKKYLDAVETYQKDRFNQFTHQIEEYGFLKSNYKDSQLSKEYQKTKKQITRNTPSIDIVRGENESIDKYNERITNARNSRKTVYEVPQTVYDMLGFISGMTKLTTEYPYVLQSVTGLDEAYKNYFDLKDPYMGSGDNKITITCLEYIDMRVTSMFNKYFNAAYDRQYKRERLPMNMRRFQCSIFVHDIRNFKNVIADMLNQDISERYNSILGSALHYMSAVEFKFYDCEIDRDETGNLFDNVSNVDAGEMRSTKFTFTYGNCVINFLPFDDLKKYFSQSELPAVSSDRIQDAINQKVQEDTGIVMENKKKEIPLEYKDSEVKPDNERNAERQQSKEKIMNTKVESKKDIVDMKDLGFVDDYTSIKQQPRVDDGNFRRWFDKSSIGNVNNNDYRDYIRRDTSVAVDDMYKSTMVNSFALNSVVNKNTVKNDLDDALRRMLIGISASTGIPVSGVTDALNIKFIDPIINKKPIQSSDVSDLGVVQGSNLEENGTVKNLGNVNKDDKKKGGK